MTATVEATPVSVSDPVNREILEVSEDRITGFRPDPTQEIARLSGVEESLVISRLRAMLRAGTIRRIRQTLLATNLAQGALIAWKLPDRALDVAFDFLLENDPFTGHIVIRSAEREAPGTDYRLWTTLKVPSGYDLERHCEVLASRIDARSWRIMPALRAFALGVGHLRRRGLEIGARASHPAIDTIPAIVDLDEMEWQVLMSLKREFLPEEITSDLWSARAREAGVDLETFLAVGRELDRRGVIGRFSTFLEHTKPLHGGERVTSFNGLLQWAVPAGREIDAGREIGRHLVLTHCYWRDGGPELNGVNIMAVAHSTDKETVSKQKAAIDLHVAEAGIEILYSNVFWGVRSEVRPSEISPVVYREWCQRMELDPASMRASI